MSKNEFVAYGIADTFNNPPTIAKDSRVPTPAELERQAAAFNAAIGKERYVVARIRADGSVFIPGKPEDVGPWRLGAVKWFDRDRGYGFITVEGAEESVFCHFGALKAGGINKVEKGEIVSLRFGRTERGLAAVEVRRA